MASQDLSNYLNKHCRFRFRGGKEAFGVIWEADGTLVFTSKERHDRLLLQDLPTDASDLLQIDSADVMIAELIE
jgi:hypothetical protein